MTVVDVDFIFKIILLVKNSPFKICTIFIQSYFFTSALVMNCKLERTLIIIEEPLRGAIGVMQKALPYSLDIWHDNPMII